MHLSLSMPAINLETEGYVGGDNINGKLVPFSESLFHSQINSEEKVQLI